VSIGSATSGGITALRVSDLTIDGAANAFHIKSNIKLGGLVHDVEFDDVCVRNSRNPIFIETHYDSSGHEVDGTTPDKLPHFTDIRFNDVLVQGGGKIMLDGLDAEHRIDVSFHDVFLDDPAKFNVVADHAAIQLDGSNIPIAGDDVTVSAKPSSASPKSCADRFVPFPAPISKVR
jgi:polygalacturonase